MGRGNPNPPHKFKKGVSGNPKGRPKTPAHLAHISRLTKDEINLIFSKYCRMTGEELQRASKDAKIPALEAWIASGIVSGILEGNWYNLNVMFDRIFGKPQPLTLEAPPDTAPQVIVTLPSNGKEAITIDANIDEDQQ